MIACLSVAVFRGVFSVRIGHFLSLQRSRSFYCIVFYFILLSQRSVVLDMSCLTTSPFVTSFLCPLVTNFFCPFFTRVFVVTGANYAHGVPVPHLHV